MDKRINNWTYFVFTEQLITSYFVVARKSLQENVPKAITHFLINYIVENVQSHLVNELYETDQAEDLLSETTENAERRKEAEDVLKVRNNL